MHGGSVLVLATLLVLALFAVCTTAAWQTFANQNDAPGVACSGKTPPFVCLGSYASVAACVRTCAAHPTCSIAIWSNSTQHCMMRTDGHWLPVVQTGIFSACDDAVVSGCSAKPSSGDLTVTVDTQTILGRTHPNSPAVNFDFWRPDDVHYGKQWGHSGALNIDLNDPQLRALTSLLAPGILRLGGSPEDSVIFDADGKCVPQSGGEGPSPSYFCSQVHPYVYDCMTPSRWNDLLEFAYATGLKVALGLNGCYGRQSATSPMDFSNIEALFAATVKSPYASALWGFEFTNEVVPNRIDPGAWAKDMLAVKKLAAKIFGDAGLPMPGLVGPDQSGCLPIQAVATQLAPHVLDAYTYHQYPQCRQPDTGDGFLLDPACLVRVDLMAAQCADVAKKYSQGKPPFPAVWAGETADHSHGGIPGLTDTFRSSIYYAWQLGALPAIGVELAARQTLSGGDYELLQRVGFNPNPDFYIVWLFRSLIGGGAEAYNVTQSVPVSGNGVRVFAFSAAATTKATTTILALNAQDPAQTSKAVTITLNGLGGTARTEYKLTADPNEPHGTVSCNGIPLTLDAKTRQPPAWTTLGVPAKGPLTLPPGTIVFATFK